MTSLATKLFSFNSFKSIIESGNSSYLTFFLPLCLLNVGLSEERLDILERINLMEIAFYYCLILREESKSVSGTLPQKKNMKNRDIRLFDDNFLIEISNTLFSHLSILYSHNGTINMNRLSSNPLEHTFGLIRMRSRYSHTYQNAIKSLGKVELLRRISKIIQPDEPISGRKSYYGQIIFNNFSKFQSIFVLDPREIAICFHLYLNLPITYDAISCDNMDDLLLIANQIVENFELAILSIYYRCYPKHRNPQLNSNEIVKMKGNIIITRFSNKNSIKKINKDTNNQSNK